MFSAAYESEERTLNLLATGGITLSIDISPRHFLELSSDQVRWSTDGWRLNYLRIALDAVDIITIEGFELVKLVDCKEIREERKNTEGFQLEWNRAWLLNIDLAKACFPYEHQFTEAIQNELFSIRKWLKEIHSSGGPKEKPLPSDLVIKVRNNIFLKY